MENIFLFFVLIVQPLMINNSNDTNWSVNSQMSNYAQNFYHKEEQTNAKNYTFPSVQTQHVGATVERYRSNLSSHRSAPYSTSSSSSSNSNYLYTSNQQLPSMLNYSLLDNESTNPRLSLTTASPPNSSVSSASSVNIINNQFSTPNSTSNYSNFFKFNTSFNESV